MKSDRETRGKNKNTQNLKIDQTYIDHDTSSFLSYSITHIFTEWEMFVQHCNTFPKWKKSLAAYVLSNTVVCGPMALFSFIGGEHLMGLAASVLKKKLDLNELL